MKLAPQGHYNLNGGTLVGSTLHDLNTIDSRNPEIDGITDTDRDAPTGDELDNDEDSTSGGDCGPQEYGSLALQRVDGQNPEQTMSMDNEGSRSPYGVLTLNDIAEIGRADSDYSSDESRRSGLSDGDSYEASLHYGGTDDTRLRSRKGMSVAQWDAARGTAEVVVKKGKAWITTGFTRGSQHLAFIEEVVFMVEQGSLVLLEEERVIHLLEAYSLVSSPLYGCSWDNYQVYSYLRKLGYTVGRHNVPWTLPKKRPPMPPAQLENLSVQFAEVKVSGGARDDDILTEMLTEVSSQSKRVESIIASSSETEAGVPAIASLHEAWEILTTRELQDQKSSNSDMKLMYDVHLPNARFKKSNPGLPAFSLCTTSSLPPHRAEVRALEQSIVDRPVKFASVICDHVAVYSFDAIELPTLP